MKLNADIPVSEAMLKDRLIETSLLSEQVQRAFDIALASHGEQLTKDGTSYLTNHLFPVANELLDNYEGKNLEEALTIALLHDVLEDDPRMDIATLEARLPHAIVHSIQVLTRQPESHGANTATKLELSKQYMQAILESNYDIRIVKLADRIVNLSLVERLKDSNPEKFNGYLKETEQLFIPLAKITSNTYVARLSGKLNMLRNVR